jgi:hypothetical protein
MATTTRESCCALARRGLPVTCHLPYHWGTGRPHSMHSRSGHLVTSLQLASAWVSCPIKGILMTRRAPIIWLISVFVCVPSGAQEGYYGIGHDRWHREFYSKLNRNDGKGTCCDLMDCRPTQSRMVGDHYEVKVDGEWTPVPNDKINNVVAPDGGAHVCAPKQVGPNKGVVFCVVLPPEG